jgi:phosphoribosylamine---glycine ligase
MDKLAPSVMIVGGGGREHALAWTLRRQRPSSRLIVSPGNTGISQIAECFPVSPVDLDGQVELALREKPDLVLVAPDDPLALGLVDRLQAVGIRAFGPTARAARIESSKAYSKKLMADAGVPTASFGVFDDPVEARDYILSSNHRVVVKASGLAAGKGAIVTASESEALAAIEEIMVDRAFGDAGDQVVIEEFMEGEEASLFAICDGRNFHTLVPAQDHKPVFDGDKGPNTGGMGAYAPAPVMTPDLISEAEERVIEPVLRALEADDSRYVGMLYVGLMISPDGPKVVEINCRWGDPEAQVLLPLLKTDMLDLMNASIDGTLDTMTVEQSDEAAVVVMLASGGYPGSYEKGLPITGVDFASEREGVTVFHSGTDASDEASDDALVTAGGRVLGVTAVAEDIRTAIERAYIGVADIRFDQMHYRRDIGHHALKRLG